MVFRKSKRATEMNQQLIMTVLFILFTIFLILFLMKSCDMIKDKLRQIQLAELESGVRGVIEVLSSKFGSIEQNTFAIPIGIDSACFVDLNYTDIIISETQLDDDYPVIKDNLMSGDRSNMFLIEESKVMDTLYVGELCLKNFPHYSCIATQSDTLQVWFEGAGECANLYFNWSIFPENYKNFSKYNTSNWLFLIQERRPDTTILNWREILAISPLTLFREQGISYVYNYSVTYKVNNIDMTPSNITFVMDSFGTNTSYLFNSTFTGPIPPGYNITTLSTKNSDYFNFWLNYSGLVVSNYYNYDSAVVASLLASYINTPIIFVNDNNIDNFQSFITGKQVFIIYHNQFNLGTYTFDIIKQHARRYQLISDSLLLSSGEVPSFALLFGNINITS